jgi:hypothetical protein
MTTPGKSKGRPSTPAATPPLSPDPWRKAAGKKPCKNCPRWFKPREKGGSEQLFCTDDCRKEFHRNGAAFGKLREQLPKMIGKEVERHAPAIVEQLRAEMRAAIADCLHHEFDFIERKEIGAEGLRLVRRAVERARARLTAPPPPPR